tara:strand:- start:2380 stop:2835 length:456 start_codon:yes stop_codon:yes gene_type:complete
LKKVYILVSLLLFSGCSTQSEKSQVSMLDMMTSADSAYSDGRLGTAETLYLKVLERDPEYTEANLKLGNIYNRQGRLDAAASSYSEILKRNPDDARAWYNLSLTRFYQASATLEQGRHKVNSGSPYYSRLVNLHKYLLEVSSGIGDEENTP